MVLFDILLADLQVLLRSTSEGLWVSLSVTMNVLVDCGSITELVALLRLKKWSDVAAIRPSAIELVTFRVFIGLGGDYSCLCEGETEPNPSTSKVGSAKLIEFPSLALNRSNGLWCFFDDIRKLLSNLLRSISLSLLPTVKPLGGLSSS